METFYIDRVLPCTCADHGRVRLRGPEGGPEIDVKVDAATVQALAAELQGVPSSASPYVDILEVALEAMGVRIVSVLLTEREAGTFESHLCLSGYRDVRIRVPEGAALVAAFRLDLPVWHRGPADEDARPTEVPQAFHDAFQAGADS